MLMRKRCRGPRPGSHRLSLDRSHARYASRYLDASASVSLSTACSKFDGLDALMTGASLDRYLTTTTPDKSNESPRRFGIRARITRLPSLLLASPWAARLHALDFSRLSRAVGIDIAGIPPLPALHTFRLDRLVARAEQGPCPLSNTKGSEKKWTRAIVANTPGDVAALLGRCPALEEVDLRGCGPACLGALGFSANALDVVEFRLVGPDHARRALRWTASGQQVEEEEDCAVDASLLDTAPSFTPSFMHQVFDEEQICGYEGLRVVVTLSALDLRAHVHVSALRAGSAASGLRWRRRVRTEAGATTSMSRGLDESRSLQGKTSNGRNSSEGDSGCRTVTVRVRGDCDDVAQVLRTKGVVPSLSPSSVATSQPSSKLRDLLKGIATATATADGHGHGCSTPSRLSPATAIASAPDTFPPGSRGRLVGRYEREMPDHRNVVFEMYRSPLGAKAPPAMRELFERLEGLSLLLIDGASAVDADDDRWEVLTLYAHTCDDTCEKPCDDEAPGSTSMLPRRTTGKKIVGFISLFTFTNPLRARPLTIRICQAVVLPPYQRAGHGAAMLRAVYDCAATANDGGCGRGRVVLGAWPTTAAAAAAGRITNTITKARGTTASASAVHEVTVEDPCPAFRRLRDAVDLAHARAHAFFLVGDSDAGGDGSSDNWDHPPSSKEQLMKPSYVEPWWVSRDLTKAELRRAQEELRITTKQIKRTLEMSRLDYLRPHRDAIARATGSGMGTAPEMGKGAEEADVDVEEAQWRMKAFRLRVKQRLVAESPAFYGGQYMALPAGERKATLQAAYLDLVKEYDAAISANLHR